MKAILHKLLRILKKIGSVAVEVCADAYYEIILLILSVIVIGVCRDFEPYDASSIFGESADFVNKFEETSFYLFCSLAVVTLFQILLSVWFAIEEDVKERHYRRKAQKIRQKQLLESEVKK